MEPLGLPAAAERFNVQIVGNPTEWRTANLRVRCQCESLITAQIVFQSGVVGAVCGPYTW